MGGIRGPKRLTGTVGLLLLAMGFIAAAAFLYSQGLDRSTQWVGLVGGAIAVVAVARTPAETLVSWRKYGGVLARAKVGDIAEDLAKAVDKDWREWRKWRDETDTAGGKRTRQLAS